MIWRRFIPLLLLLAAVMLWLHSVMGEYAPALLLLCATHAGLRCPPERAAVMWWATGMVRDLAIGVALGASALFFLAAGGLVLALRRRVRRENPGVGIGLVFGLAFLLRVAEPFLAWGPAGAAVGAETVRAGMASAALTAGLVLPWGWMADRVRVWRTERAAEAAF